MEDISSSIATYTPPKDLQNFQAAKGKIVGRTVKTV
jgi:hypothetical protein